MKIYKLVYSNENKDRFRIFDPYLVEKNKYKYKIIYKNKLYPLKGIFNYIIDNKIEKLKIKLIYYNNISDKHKISYSLQNYGNERYIKNINMYKSIDYLLCSSHEIQKLKYKIHNENKIKIFGEEFVENNGNKCSIIYKNKIFPLQSYFLFKNINKEDRVNRSFEILLCVLEIISNRSYMFRYCKSLIEFANFDISDKEMKDISIKEENSLDSEITDECKNCLFDCFDGCLMGECCDNFCRETLEYFPSEFNIINKTKRNCYSVLKNMSYMFSNCSSLISLPDISKWNTNNVKDMSYMFYYCSSLVSLPDVSEWNTNNVTDMSRCFLIVSFSFRKI